MYDGSDNLLRRFQYADGRMPVAMTKAGSTYYLAYDQVGSLRVVADHLGNVVKQITYDTFGNIITDTNPLFEIPLAFAGGLYDPDTGLIRFGFRDYDPEIGRWTAKDPIFFTGGDVDLFGYVLNDPVNWIDPTGEIVFIGTAASYGAYALGSAIAFNLLHYGAPLVSDAGTWLGNKFGVWLADKLWNEKTEDVDKKCPKKGGLKEKWEDFNKNPSDWEKVDEKDDNRQPQGGYSRREKWRNKKTGEELGIHQKYPSGKTKKGKPKHPHPFPLEIF